MPMTITRLRLGDESRANGLPVRNVQLIGEQGTGVSSLIIRMARDVYTDTYIPTIGADYYTVVAEDEQRRAFALRLFDVPSSRFRHVHTRQNPPDVLMIVCDPTDRRRFKKLQEDLDDWKRQFPEVPIMMVVTKTDVPGPWAVSEKEIGNFAKDNGIDLDRVRYINAKEDGNTGVLDAAADAAEAAVSMRPLEEVVSMQPPAQAASSVSSSEPLSGAQRANLGRIVDGLSLYINHVNQHATGDKGYSYGFFIDSEHRGYSRQVNYRFAEILRERLRQSLNNGQTGEPVNLEVMRRQAFEDVDGQRRGARARYDFTHRQVNSTTLKGILEDLLGNNVGVRVDAPAGHQADGPRPGLSDYNMR